MATQVEDHPNQAQRGGGDDQRDDHHGHPGDSRHVRSSLQPSSLATEPA